MKSKKKKERIKIQAGRWYKTKSGLPVKIKGRDDDYYDPTRYDGVITDKDGYTSNFMWDEDGTFSWNNRNDGNTIIALWDKKKDKMPASKKAVKVVVKPALKVVRYVKKNDHYPWGSWVAKKVSA